jgi:hypothetical protein
LSGSIMAFVYRKVDLPEPIILDDDEDEEEVAFLADNENPIQEIKYEYIENRDPK